MGKAKTRSERTSFGAIRAILRETAESQKKYQEELRESEKKFREEFQEELKGREKKFREEFQEELKERRKETERELKERRKEIEQELKERSEWINKQLGKFSNNFGEVAEYMVKPCLVDKFQELGLEFTEAAQDKVIRDKKRNVIAEVDFVLENDEKVMLIEIKSKLKVSDIADHIERIEKVRAHAHQRNDNRAYLGAIGGIVINDGEKAFALKNGIYLIQPSGETFDIIVPEGIYAPREW